MDKITQLRNAIDFAKKNPDDPKSVQLRRRIESGMYNNELTELKKKSALFQNEQAPKNALTKVASFTGGEELGQGLGQTLANTGSKGNFKTMEKDIETANQTLTNLIKQKKANQKAGKDNTRIMAAIAKQSDVIQQLGASADSRFNPNQLTEKAVIGDALQLGTTVASFGTYGNAAQGMATGALSKTTPSAVKGVTGATSFGKGFVKGAKTGLVGGTAVGASTGVSQGLQDGLSGEEILKKGITGAIEGGISGGILGGVVGGITGGLRGAKLKKENAYLDAVTPNPKDLTPAEYEDLLSRGKITSKTATSPAQYIMSEEEKLIAQKYKGLLTNDPVKNTENIIAEIAKKDEEVGAFLKKNNGIFNNGELKNSLSKKLDDITDFMVDDKKLAKAKKTIIDNFIKGLKKNDMESLWKARKAFDKQIEKAFSGSPTLQNNIKREFRNAVQDFISERTPDGVYKTSMKEMSQLFKLRDITNTKAIKEKGLNAMQVWIKKNPTKAKLIGWTAGTGIIGTTAVSMLNN